MKQAIETSDLLLKMKGPNSARRLQEISTTSRLPGQTALNSDESLAATGGAVGFQSARNMHAMQMVLPYSAAQSQTINHRNEKGQTGPNSPGAQPAPQQQSMPLM